MCLAWKSLDEVPPMQINEEFSKESSYIFQLSLRLGSGTNGVHQNISQKRMIRSTKHLLLPIVRVPQA